MPNRRAVPPSAEDTNDTRRAILSVSRNLFQELGYRSVSTRQIAEACGLTQPALYHHFANKQELYIAVHRETLSDLGAGLDRIARRSESSELRLREVARYMFLNSREDMGQMFHDLDHELDTQSRQTVNTLFFRHIVVPIASIFQMLPVTEFAREQATREVDAETAAFLFLGLMRDLKHMKVNPRADAQRADAVVDILLHGIVIRPA